MAPNTPKLLTLVFNDYSKVISMVWAREYEWFVKNPSINIAGVLADLKWFFDCCFDIYLTSSHLRMFADNMYLPKFFTTGYKNTILVPALKSGHICVLSLRIAPDRVYRLLVLNSYGSLVLLYSKIALLKYCITEVPYYKSLTLSIIHDHIFEKRDERLT